jgi:hypothetical protein
MDMTDRSNPKSLVRLALSRRFIRLVADASNAARLGVAKIV